MVKLLKENWRAEKVGSDCFTYLKVMALIWAMQQMLHLVYTKLTWAYYSVGHVDTSLGPNLNDLRSSINVARLLPAHSQTI